MNDQKQIETVIYGGAFNPPTLAHVAILKACFAYARRKGAEVWVMPSGNRHDKTIAASRSRRLAYVEAMIRDAGGDARVELLELDRRIPVETIDTVRELKARYPERIFRFVFGADSTETMGEWRGGRELLDTLPMLVVEREGSAINPQARNVESLAVQTPSVSSTQVRQCLAAGASYAHLVSPRVAQLLA